MYQQFINIALKKSIHPNLVSKIRILILKNVYYIISYTCLEFTNLKISYCHKIKLQYAIHKF